MYNDFQNDVDKLKFQPLLNQYISRLSFLSVKCDLLDYTWTGIAKEIFNVSRENDVNDDLIIQPGHW